MQILEFSPGSHISTAANALVIAAKGGAPAKGQFNGITMTADGTQTANEIVAAWQAESDRRHAAYECSPAGIAAKQQSEDERVRLQARHDLLMERLPGLDWKNDVQVLDWLCDMQEPSDRVGVIVRRETILATFEKIGFKAGANTGADYRDGDRDNMFRYLVGQAMDGLKGPAIHGILHDFAAQWKARFGLVAP